MLAAKRPTGVTLKRLIRRVNHTQGMKHLSKRIYHDLKPRADITSIGVLVTSSQTPKIITVRSQILQEKTIDKC